MAPSKALFSLLLTFLLVVMLVKKVESQGTNFNINNNFRPESTILTYEGDAYVPPGRRYLRLTPTKGSVGRVLYNFPINFWATGTQLAFRSIITLEMTTGWNDFSSGLTFFIVPVNSTLPSGGFGSNLGIYDAVPTGTPIFAVEVDNSLGDLNPDYPHVGININTRRSQNLSRIGDRTMVRGVVSLRVSYHPIAKTVSLLLIGGGSGATMTYAFDLAAILPQQVQVGLSASTGVSNVTYIDIRGWDFSSTVEPDVIGAHKNDVIKQYGM